MHFLQFIVTLLITPTVAVSLYRTNLNLQTVRLFSEINNIVRSLLHRICTIYIKRYTGNTFILNLIILSVEMYPSSSFIPFRYVYTCISLLLLFLVCIVTIRRHTRVEIGEKKHLQFYLLYFSVFFYVRFRSATVGERKIKSVR
jgi:hypothetical protein